MKEGSRRDLRLILRCSGWPISEKFSWLPLSTEGKVKLCKRLQHKGTTHVSVWLVVWTWRSWHGLDVKKLSCFSSYQKPVMSHRQLSSSDFSHKASQFLFNSVLSHPNMQPFSLSHCVSTSTRRNNRKFCHQLRSAQNPQRIKTRKIKFTEACNLSDRETLTITFTPRLHARAFCRAEKLLSEKRWRVILKTPELCLILCLADHNTQCCLSVLFSGRHKAESHATTRKEIRIKTVNMKGNSIYVHEMSFFLSTSLVRSSADTNEIVLSS